MPRFQVRSQPHPHGLEGQHFLGHDVAEVDVWAETTDEPHLLVLARRLELLSSPDFQVRLQGLEAWAQHPGTTLDAVTYALVDPEESVRARAQEVFEEELARR